jgi:putative nucleotidyltransferase with HDIG domain
MTHRDQTEKRCAGLPVLIVDDDPTVRRLFARILEQSGYTCHTATDAHVAVQLVAEIRPAVVVTDVRMPGRDGVWLLSRVTTEHPDTEVIMLTGFAEVDTAVQCLRDGASDYLTKPVRADHLLTAVERSLERRRLVLENRHYQETLEARVRKATAKLRQANREITETYEMTLVALSSVLDAREEATADHSRRVTTLSLWLAEELGIERQARNHISRAALLHDIGKIGVPDHVLLKSGPLDDADWRAMREHPGIGYRILRTIPFLEPAAEIVLSHHERFDGSGYPQGIAGEDIPVGARVFAVADAVDAITNDRPYRKAAPAEAALAEVERCAGSHFDPQVAAAMLAIGAAPVEQLVSAPSPTAADARGGSPPRSAPPGAAPTS